MVCIRLRGAYLTKEAGDGRVSHYISIVVEHGMPEVHNGLELRLSGCLPHVSSAHKSLVPLGRILSDHISLKRLSASSVSRIF